MRNPAAQPVDRPQTAFGLRHLAFVVAGVALITASAKITVPFWPVPMTFQTLSILAIALLAGPRIGISTVLAYLAVGAVGLPVFAGTPERGIGFAYMAGPTGGYLAGYVLAAWIAGTLGRNRGLIGRTMAMILAMVPVYGLGLAWLAKFVPASHLMDAGLLPFIPGDLAKIGLVAAGGSVLPGMWRRLRSNNSGDAA